MINTVSLLDRHFVVDCDDEHDWVYEQGATGDWEADTFHAIAKFVRNDWAYVDIGAWIGAMTLFASQSSARSVAVEPDPVAASQLLRTLARNLHLRDKVDVWTSPLTRDGGVKTLHSTGLGNSMTSLLDTQGATLLRTSSVGVVEFLDRALKGWDGPVFFKIDIEGGEFNVVPALVSEILNRNIRGAIHLSLHSHFVNADNSDACGWIRNVQDTSRTLAALSDFGTFYCWDGSNWLSALETGTNPLLNSSWEAFGGMATTVLVATSPESNF